MPQNYKDMFIRWSREQYRLLERYARIYGLKPQDIIRSWAFEKLVYGFNDLPDNVRAELK